jgi:superfamily I DNA/RNA helicase
MRLPSFNQLSADQRAVYFRPPSSSLLVVGPPGSGKTSMAIWRAKTVASGEVPSSAMLITKNRLLASVAGRLALEQNSSQISASTMNSFVSRDYWDRFTEKVPGFSGYDYEWDVIVDHYAKRQVQPTLDHMIIDEGQNLPPGFFRWATRFGAKAVSVFADEDQTTEGTGSKMADFLAAGFGQAIPLLANHRNTQEIVDLVQHFHVNGLVPAAASTRGPSGRRPKLLTLTSWEQLAQMVATRFRNQGGSIGVIVHLVDDIMLLHGMLSQALGGTRVDCYTSKLDQGLEHAIQMREEGVTVISGKSAIGLEFDTVYLQDLDRFLPPQSMADYRNLYMLCARAKDALFLVNGPAALNAAQLAALPPPPVLER